MSKRHSLRSAVSIAAGCIILAAAAPAPAACLDSDQPVAGELQSVPYRTSAGKRLDGYHLQLPRAICVEATDLDGVPTRIEKVHVVQIVASDPAGEQALSRLVGSRITMLGHFDVPDPDRQSGDAVLSNAELVDVAGQGSEDGAGDAAPDMETDAASGSGSDAPADEAEPGNSYGGASTQIGTTGESGYDTGSDPSADSAGSSSQQDVSSGSYDTGTQDTTDQEAVSPSVYRRTAQRQRTNRHKQTTAERSIDSRIVDFVQRYYLGSGEMDIGEIRAAYASKVSYYGKRNVPLASVIKDKVAYDKRWPTRRFDLVPGTMEIRRAGWDGQVYDISYVYDFLVSAPGRSRSGRGYARITIDLAAEGGKVVREAGKVIMRD